MGPSKGTLAIQTCPAIASRGVVLASDPLEFGQELAVIQGLGLNRQPVFASIVRPVVSYARTCLGRLVKLDRLGGGGVAMNFQSL